MGRLADQDRNAEPRPNAVDRLLESMDDDDDRQLLEGWLHDPQRGDSWIEDELRVVGYTISDSSIRRWRRDRGIKSVWAA